jgi:hypothetical protein
MRFFGNNRGQILTLYSLALPAMLGVIALALDGGKLFVNHIHLQNAADAAALASAQDLNQSNCWQGPSVTCGGAQQAAVLNQVQVDVNCYARQNNAPAGNCGAPPYAYPSIPQCAPPAITTTCFNWPYVKGVTTHWDEVEVRLRYDSGVSLAFGGLPGIPSKAYPSARAVGTYQPELSVTMINGTTIDPLTIPGSTYATTVAGSTYVTTSPNQTIMSTTTSSTFAGGTGSVAFLKSTDCASAPATATTPAGSAMQWSGAASTLTEMIINGGITINSANTHHADRIWLGKLGTPGCQVLGKGADVTTWTGPFSPPLDWPIVPPSGPPDGCTSTDTANISTADWKLTHPAGVYCWTSGQLQIGANGVTFTGYTFYAPQISINSNSMTINDDPSATAFVAYGFDSVDPISNLDSCNTGGGASNCAFSVNGGSNTINGRIFVPNGTVSVSGGGALTGNGFIEAQKMLVTGNFAGYFGTGPGDGGGITSTTRTSTSVITGTTGVTTGPDQVTSTSDTGTVYPGSTSGPSTVTSTTSTSIGLGE